MAPRRGGKAVVLKHEPGRGGSGCSRSRRASRWCGSSPQDFRGPVRKVATIDLPAAVRAAQPGVPAGDRRALAAPARRTTPSCRSRPTATVAELQAAIDAHPLHGAPGRRCRAARRRGRRIESRATSPGWNGASRPATRAWPASSTACSSVLEAWGYVDGWDAHRRGPAARPAEHRRRPRARRGVARRSPRRDRPRPRSRRWSRASPTSAAVRIPASHSRRPGGPTGQVARRARVPSRASGATCTSPNANEASRDTPPRPGLHALRSTAGRWATSSPTCSTTRR